MLVHLPEAATLRANLGVVCQKIVVSSPPSKHIGKRLRGLRNICFHPCGIGTCIDLPTKA